MEKKEMLIELFNIGKMYSIRPDFSDIFIANFWYSTFGDWDITTFSAALTAAVRESDFFPSIKKVLSFREKSMLEAAELKAQEVLVLQQKKVDGDAVLEALGEFFYSTLWDRVGSWQYCLALPETTLFLRCKNVFLNALKETRDVALLSEKTNEQGRLDA